jgi:putative membrane protein
LEDAKTLSGSLSTSISALVDAAQSGENLLKSSGTDLDAGTRQALSGLSAALRQSTKGLDQTDVIRSAKETIDALITDQWDSHAGGENNILLMDANAAPVSLTDQRNEGVQSIQYVMRSQEIKVEEESDTQTAAAVQTDNGTIWSRIVDMFRDIWQTLTGWLHKD